MGKLDHAGFCSLYIAVDHFYLDKLVMTYPTWVACHPEILHMDHVFVFDRGQLTVGDPRWGIIQRDREFQARQENIDVARARLRLIPWSMEHSQGISQREEMLTGLVRCAEQLSTPWYLKLDADTYANERKGFYYDKWFSGNPCYISNPWGYAKDGLTLDVMNAWALGVPELKDLPEVPGTKIYRTPGEHPPWKVNWSRMASWVQFGNTKWTSWCSSLCKDARLPTPSQDTYLSFIQRRTDAPWVPVKFKELGWLHCRNTNGLRNACAAVINSLKDPQ